MDKFIKEICYDVFTRSDVDKFRNTTILITGANGLIGGFLADFFHYLNTERNYNIKLFLMSLSDKPARLQHLLKLQSQNIRYISKDLSTTIDSNTVINDSVDYCFYCAGYAQPAKFLSDPLKTYFLNTSGVNGIFEKVFNKNKSARCIFLSSSEIYACNDTTDSHKETDNINIDLTHKRYSYILGKVGGEAVTNAFRENGYNASSVRVSLCYGPGVLSDDTRVLSELVSKGINKATINLFDSGAAARKYLHISDFCVMLLNIAATGTEPVYNVGGKEQTTIYDIAECIGEYYNKKVVKGKTNNQVSNSAPKTVWVSLKRYEEEFENFKFKSLSSGLQEFIEWYETNEKSR